MQKHGPVPKAEDKSPAKKKRQREQHNEDAKKAKIEEKVAQSAWSAAIKSKTDKTVEDKEDSTDKTDVEQGNSNCFEIVLMHFSIISFIILGIDKEHICFHFIRDILARR